MNKTVSLRAYLFASLIIATCLFYTTTFAHPSNLDNFKVLVYNFNTNQEIVTALPILGINNFDLHDNATLVTETELASYDVLIVGWNESNETAGFESNALLNGITGNIVLTGHDLDYHTCSGPEESRTFFEQMIGFALEGGGCGLIGLSDHSTGFSWLPNE